MLIAVPLPATGATTQVVGGSVSGAACGIAESLLLLADFSD
jgi:hypothetical protein